MAQAGFTPLLLYVNTTTSAVPSAGNLANGELALNAFTGRLYYKTPAGVVTVIADAASGVGVTTFSAGTTGLTPSTATNGAITLAGTLNVANGGTGLTTLTAGSLTYGAGTSAYTALAIGTAGQVLTSTGTAPQWSTLSAVTTLSGGTTGLTPATATSGAITLAGTLVAANGGTGFASYTVGDILYASTTTAFSKLPASTSGYVLTTNGAGTAPSWTNVSIAAGVSTISFGSTGLTPSTATGGSIVVGGTLATGNGGTGLTSFSTNGAVYATSSSALTTGTLPAVSGGTSFSTYALGDILYGAASNTLSKLTLGSSGQVLTAGASAPQYVAQSSLSVGTATNVAGGVANQVHYQTGVGATGFIAAPTVASTFLQWNGSAFAWATAGLTANATVTGLLEATNVVAAAPSTTQNIDVITSTVWYYTANTSANWVLNLRGNSGTSLNTVMAVGTAVTVVFAATNSTTAYYQTTIQVDGLTQTVRWQGGAAPTTGNVSSVDIYTMTVFKTSATPTYSVFASQVKFA